MKKIYVGNLKEGISESEMRELFTQYGTVHFSELAKNRKTGNCSGYGFIEMDDQEATTAISMLDGKLHNGQALRVTQLTGC